MAMQKLIVFYIPIHDMPVAEAEKYVRDVRDRLSPSFHEQAQCLFIPSRTETQLALEVHDLGPLQINQEDIELLKRINARLDQSPISPLIARLESMKTDQTWLEQVRTTATQIMEAPVPPVQTPHES